MKYFNYHDVQFQIYDIDLLNAEFYTREGEVLINGRKRFSDIYLIETEAEINGSLFHKQLNIEMKYYKRKQENDIWIKLLEPEIVHSDLLSSGNSVIELFIELIKMNSPKKIYEFPMKSFRYFIQVIAINYEEGLLKVKRLPKSEYIIPPDASSQLRKQKNALIWLRDLPTPHQFNLLKLFQNITTCMWNPVIISDNNIIWEFLKEDGSGKLREGTKTQRNFVLTAINTPDYAILEGPPGSGKTTAITELIYQLVKRKKRILMVASTHVAVDNVLEKLIEDLGNPELVMNNGIVPLRIGDEDRISEDLLSFQIDNRYSKLLNQMKKSGFQINDGNDEFRNPFVEQILMKSSNLIVGTSIGILQYPNFQDDQKRDKLIIPEFDYLIIDESSKTTLQQFFVSAIHAKKWILAGDIKQLPPYIDDLFIRISLEGIISPSMQYASMIFRYLVNNSYFMKNYYYNKWAPRGGIPGIVIPISIHILSELGQLIQAKLENQKLNEYLRKDIGKFNDINKLFITEKIKEKELNLFSSLNIKTIIQPNYESQYKLTNYPIIFIDEKYLPSYINSIPFSHELINIYNKDNESSVISDHLLKLKFRQNYFRKNHQIIINNEFVKGLERITEELGKSWAGQVSWRIRRIYELDETRNKKTVTRYEKEIHSLIPEIKHNQIYNQIKDIERVFFPSILTSLQKGFMRSMKDQNYRNILHTGFPKNVLRDRHMVLNYQHRMHDEIADHPRNLYYAQDGSLNSSTAILSEGIRNWPDSPYRKDVESDRVFWIDIIGNDKFNLNRNEASFMLSELGKFIDWAKEKSSNRNWTVLLLSYYNKQKDFLGELLKKQYKFLPQSARSHFQIYNVSVKVYTVDKVQGREGDIVFLSMVRNKKIGFMDSPNRLNVAISRAKYLLFFIGNYSFFSDKRNHDFGDITRICRKIPENCIRNSNFKTFQHKASSQRRKSL
ncbi:MAG: AAA family ATPase [Candidatus Heimdallarchaeota archaeon]|nr:AAA family ATPase [Candidatus Heimdallarchaeota archaeon]